MHTIRNRLNEHTFVHRVFLDPSPTELIIKFMAIAPDLPIERPPPLCNDNDQAVEPKKDEIKRSKKSLALKIMTLKIAAFLKWDLDTLEAKYVKVPLSLWHIL
jgi:integrator complex subunit 8